MSQKSLTYPLAHLADCVFCTNTGGEILWQNDMLRVVQVVDEPDYPGFCRVIWHAHLSEFSLLTPTQRHHLIDVVTAVERALHQVMQPDKINLASLGNQVPHLHWHIIPRYRDDTHFPNPIWASRVRNSEPAKLSARAQQAKMLGTALLAELQHEQKL